MGKHDNDNMATLGLKWEFVRGPVPLDHHESLSGSEQRRIDEKKVIKFGKYKGRTQRHVLENDKNYYRWAVRQGLVADLDGYKHR